jgi:hypothetical protein
MKMQRIRADHAFRDIPLLEDRLAKRKMLLWRIGNRWHEVRDLEKDDTAMRAFLDERPKSTAIKGATMLTILYLSHVHYARLAGELLFHLQNRVEGNISVLIHRRQVWEDHKFFTNDFYFSFVPLLGMMAVNFVVESHQFESESIEKLATIGARLMNAHKSQNQRLEPTNL